MAEIIVLLVTVAAAVAVGCVLRARSGKLRATESRPPADRRRELLVAAGLGTFAAPAVLHFSAEWCGPCAAVRRVIGQVLADTATAANGRPVPVEVELDIDEHPALARELGVLSLPTTFIFDASLTERFRVSGVPSAADLRDGLEPLRGPHDPGTGRTG